ncbi:MAG: T9SS type A sorting domain-containing protein, partial [Mesonia sp.]
VADEVLVEEGDVVTYTDLTTNNPTAWEWTFEGGTPATSTDENPMVTYDLEGVYAVTLKTTNAAGNNEVIKTDYIVVEDELSVESNLKDIVSIYPNPTQGNLFVVINDLSGQAINVQVFDLLGRKVTQVNGMQTTGSQQEIRLDFSEFSSSEQLYIVEISIGNKTARYKVLKSN